MSVWASLRAALRLLGRRDRRLLVVVTILQSALSVLDVVAVTLIGLVALLTAGAATGQYPASVESWIQRLSLADVDPYRLAAMLAVIAGVLLVAKSAASFYAARRTLTFLAHRQAAVSSDLASRLLRRPLLFVMSRSSQEIGFSLTAGVNALTLGVLGNAVTVATECTLLVLLSVTLLFFDPVVTIFTIVFFTLIGFALYRLTSSWASRMGRQAQDTQIASFEAVQTAVRTYREITVSGRRRMFAERFRDLRWESSRVQADLQVIGQVSKYVFEVALILGGALLAISQLVTRDISAAVAGIAIFLAAASRIMPSLLRLQSALVQVRAYSGTGAQTLALAAELDATSGRADLDDDISARVATGLAEGYPGFVGEVRMEDVGLRYPGSETAAVAGISLTVPPGTSIGLVGSTGAGKSTLADLALGVLTADAGTVLLSGMDPAEAISRWPGAIGYVPQDIAVMNADIRSNVALGLPRELVDDERVWRALEQAHLADFLRSERDGLDTVVGEYGVRLSGGQRQRLGLARALYTSPRLIVLDEATSALDAETEWAISQSIAELAGDVTLVIIAHRLATIRDCTQVAVIEGGRLVALGTFDEVRGSAASLDRQARLLGL